MEVNNNKFDKAYHHPIYTLNKLIHIVDEVKGIMEGLDKAHEHLKAIVRDVSLYRQELLSSIKENTNGVVKDIHHDED